eukprot:c28945_g2_i2 orf=650-2620(+)
MPDDIFMYFSSNSDHSDPTLPLKLAKLEARMAGKSSSVPLKEVGRSGQLTSGSTAAVSGNAMQTSSTESDDDHGVEEFLIQPNLQKRKKYGEDEENMLQHPEGEAEGMSPVNTDLDKQFSNRDETNKKRGRGRGGRTIIGRISKVNDLQHLSTSVSNTDLQNGHSEDEIASLRCKTASLEEELFKVRQEFMEFQQSCQQLGKEVTDVREQGQQRAQKHLKVISDLLIVVAKYERQEARMRIRHDSLRLGNLSVVRAGTVISEAWEDGQALKDIQSHLKSLIEQREAAEKHRKYLRKGKSERFDGNDGDLVMSEEDFLLQEEMCRSRLLGIKREEDAVLKDRERYELEKMRHIREMKRVRDEDGSRFSHFPILNKRFALLNLLGKGGFSEVYKAYDLAEHRYVACKLHSLNPQWSEEKKQSYIRHAIREYDIHKNLRHPHIVRLWDIFEIDHSTFCTVLEYCSGKDLDAILKATPILPEREVRCILVQIFSGLVYMNRRPQRIIHYDLKPGNVLFDDLGAVKMTDFGLSKILEEEVGSQGMELTSQGAGTYWYLPPECFEVGKTPLISSKVDVWSVGVMSYQMLFGKRPFGHDQTQERILREDTITKAHKVEFPSKPSVSNEAKDFIRRCLTYNQAERPDVLTVAQDPYLSYLKRKP